MSNHRFFRGAGIALITGALGCSSGGTAVGVPSGTTPGDPLSPGAGASASAGGGAGLQPAGTAGAGAASATPLDPGELPGTGGSSEPPPVVPEFETLREAAAAAGKLIGVAVDAPALQNDPTYAQVLAREFDYVTPEDSGKWGSLAPTDSSYAFQNLDTIVEFAEQNAQAVKGHTFVWHQQTPSWLNESMTAEEVSTALQSHIEATLARYRGRMRAWDVVNEAVDVSTASGYTDSIFYRKLGPSYIEDAFRWARAADPDILLFYNEIGIERMSAKSDFTYAMLSDLLARGVPIDGIGFQSHVSIHRYPAESNLRENFRRFAELGLRVNVSEADARVLPMPGDQATRWQAQRVAFQQIVGACALEPSCEAVTLWGFTDRYSWINDDGGADEPLIFDRDYARKPAYDGVVAGLAGVLPLAGANTIDDGDFASGAAGWSASGGELSVSAAVGREGNAACVTGQNSEGELIREGLRDALALGGPLVFSAWVRLQGASTANVEATLRVQETGLEPKELSLATIGATDGEWVELAGYFGLGFEAPPTEVTLAIRGPATLVTLCASDVRIQPLSAP